MKKQLWGHFLAALDGAGRLAPSDWACHQFDVTGAVRCAVTLGLGVILALLTLLAPSTQAAAPERRQAVENRAFFALQPIENQAAELQTHTADVDVTVRDGLLIASVDALYRLQNSENEAITVLARVVAQVTAQMRYAPRHARGFAVPVGPEAIEELVVGDDFPGALEKLLEHPHG